MMARFYSLSEIHQRIDARLRLEQRRILPDQLELTRLKKMKLRIKDKLHRLLIRQATPA